MINLEPKSKATQGFSCFHKDSNSATALTLFWLLVMQLMIVSNAIHKLDVFFILETYF